MLCMTKTNNIDYRMYNAYVFIHIIYIYICLWGCDRPSECCRPGFQSPSQPKEHFPTIEKMNVKMLSHTATKYFCGSWNG